MMSAQGTFKSIHIVEIAHDLFSFAQSSLAVIWDMFHEALIVGCHFGRVKSMHWGDTMCVPCLVSNVCYTTTNLCECRLIIIIIIWSKQKIWSLETNANTNSIKHTHNLTRIVLQALKQFLFGHSSACHYSIQGFWLSSKWCPQWQ